MSNDTTENVTDMPSHLDITATSKEAVEKVRAFVMKHLPTWAIEVKEL